YAPLPPPLAPLPNPNPIWGHAASVGEVLAAQPLVTLLQEYEPEHPILMTTTTVTGRETARNQLRVPATLLPADVPWIVRRALRRLRPAALVILETEFCPNLFRLAVRHG